MLFVTVTFVGKGGLGTVVYLAFSVSTSLILKANNCDQIDPNFLQNLSIRRNLVHFNSLYIQ